MKHLVPVLPWVLTMRLRLLLGCHLLLSLSACSEDDTTAIAHCSRSVVSTGGEAILGQGYSFVSVEDGDIVEVEKGIQNLYHIVLHARIAGLELGERGDRNSLPLSTFDVSGEMFDPAECADRVTYVRAPSDLEGVYELERPLTKMLNIRTDDEAIAIDGSEVTLTLDVVDNQGTHAYTEKTVVLFYDASKSFADAGVPDAEPL